jgi:3-methyladenine DNA glycosylase/8-oxoguanine DNA glycosylase
VESHGWYRLAPFRWSPDEAVLRRREVLDGRVVELEMRAEGDVLRVAASPVSTDHSLPPRPPRSLDFARGDIGAGLQRRIARMFQLHLDLAEFHALTRNSPAHQWVERSGFGRLLCAPTMWEDAVKIIATTNTMWSQTVRMIELLVAKCGREGAFPSQADVLRFSAEELQRDCRLGYRAKSIHALAALDLESFVDAGATTKEQYRLYQKLPGIGPYGAAHLLAMDGRHDFIAVDSEFRRFVRDTYHGGRKVTDAAMLRRYAKWGRWQYLAYWSDMWGRG